MHINNPVRTVAIFTALFVTIVKIDLLVAQNLSGKALDSLYNKFVQIKAPELVEKPVTLSRSDLKCGFDLVNSVKLNFNNFSEEQQKILQPLVSRPTLETSIDSPFGFFRIHYNTTGPSMPSYITGSVDANVMEVAIALDSVYKYEIQYLNYPLPPPDNNGGGNNLYDVYIVNQPGGLYGYTETEQKVGTTNWSSFMVIDNNYTGFYSEGIAGMQVTVAHEFHHGIQLGNYGLDGPSPYRNQDVFFYEITSTSMEEFVFDDVNDYYAYMPDYFISPDESFPGQNGYNLAIWNIFLQENFGFEILKRQWELIPTVQAILAVNQSLIDFSSSFPSQLNKFGIWTFFTSFRRVPGKYFEEAENYPLISTTFNIQFPSPPPQMNAEPTTNNFVKFTISANNDTLIAIVTNGDAFAAAQNPSQLFGFNYTLYADATSGQRQLTSEYSSDFSVSNPNFWSVSEILNNVIVRQDSVIFTQPGTLGYAFPNPFYYGRNYLTGTYLFFPVDLIPGEETDFNVYTSGMKLVYSSERPVQNLPGEQQGISWDGLDNNGERLGSGIYIYVIKKDDETVTGKVVIFNE